MKKNFTTIIILFFLVTSASVKASVYYISSSGNDGNNGLTIGTAWKTITNINAMDIAPGDTFLFEGGQTFTGGLYLDSLDANDSTAIVTFSSYGTGKAIISSGAVEGFYAYNSGGITVSNLIFEGSGISTNTTKGVEFYTDFDGSGKLVNETIKNVEVRQYGGEGITIGAWNNADNVGYRNVLIDSVLVHHVKENGITTWGWWDQFNTGWSHENVIIRNTVVHDVPGFSASGHRGSGIIMAQVNGGLMENCVAYDNGSGNTNCGGPGGIWAWDCNNVTLQFCEAYRNHSGTGCDGLGFDFDGGMTNSIMQYNYSHDNDGAGMLLGQFDYSRPWFNNIIRYNISENDARTNGGAITLFKGPITTMSGAIIYHNTVYITPANPNPDVSAFDMVEWDDQIDSTVVYNNIFQTTGGVPLVNTPSGYFATFNGNLYWSTGAAFKIRYDGTVYNDLASWRTATSNEMVGITPTGMVADPLLSSAGSGGTVYPYPVNQLGAYQLNPSSPAISGGVDLMAKFGINSGNRDFFNNTAPYGTAPDIGANESSVITMLKALKAANEGLSVYPNPVAAGTKIIISSDDMFSSVEITDMLGKQVVTPTKVENRSIGISTVGLQPGVYFVKITDSEGVQKSKKLVVE